MLKQLINFIDRLPTPIYRFMLLVTTITICYLAFSKGGVQIPVSGGDKISHFCAFFVLTWLLSHALKMKKWQQILILMSFGLFIEIVQSKLPGRFASNLDLLADLVGVMAFFLFHWIYYARLKPTLLSKNKSKS